MTSSRRLALAFAATAVLAAPATARVRIYPAWSVTGSYDLTVSPGYASVSGEFGFPLAGGTASVSLGYAKKHKLRGAGIVTVDSFPTFFALEGAFSVDGDGVQHVHLEDLALVPLWSFDGTVSEDGADIVGTFDQKDGYLGFTGAAAGEVTIHRTDGPPPLGLELAFATRMDTKGNLRGALAPDDSDTTATLTLYGGTVLTGGRIRGRVVTDRNARTRAGISIVGPGWRAKLAGPVDQTGFHAVCNLKGGGYSVTRVPVELAVQPGPTPPPGPPPPPPKNQLTGVTATVAGGKITLSDNEVPGKFFGTTAALRIEFPSSVGQTVTHADPAAATLTEPDARRCIVTMGSTTYGTAIAPADVTLDIRRITSTFSGGQIEVLATGTVVAANGRKKTVDVLIEATVQ